MVYFKAVYGTLETLLSSYVFGICFYCVETWTASQENSAYGAVGKVGGERICIIYHICGTIFSRAPHGVSH